MLLVKTNVGISPIHGIGLFAGEDISEGEVIWEYNPNMDRQIDGITLSGLDEEFVRIYAYHDKQLDKWILPIDNDRFTNHSECPNTGPLEDGRMVARQCIECGEELTIDYREIDQLWNQKLLDQCEVE